MNHANYHLVWSSTVCERDGLEETISHLKRMAEEAVLSKSTLLLEVYAERTKDFAPQNVCEP
jgi:hypothetical protein